MALKPPPIGDVIQQVNELVGNSGLRGEVDKSVKALVQNGLSRLDVVSREEFDAQAAILQRTRAEVEKLERQLQSLSEALDRADANK